MDESQIKGKIYVPDTSVFIDNPECIEIFGDNRITIASVLIKELDGLKRKRGERGLNSRLASRAIKRYIEQGLLSKGIPTQSGGMVYGSLEHDSKVRLPKGIEDNPDNRIIFLAKYLQKQYPHAQVILVSTDINFHIMASMAGIAVQDFKGQNGHKDPYTLFYGIREIEVADRSLIDELYQAGSLNGLQIGSYLDVNQLKWNQSIMLKYQKEHALAIYSKEDNTLRVVRRARNGKSDKNQGKKISPINNEQAIAYAMLMNPKIDLVSLVGKAGSGKTLISLLAGLDQLRPYFDEDDHVESGYNQIMVLRSTVSLGQEMGFLPGKVDEKFDPWTKPIFENIEVIKGITRSKQGTPRHPAQKLIEEGLLEILPINHIKGRTLRNKFIIVDEAEDITPEEIKAVITRHGKGSKMVLTGDITQINHPYLNRKNNGISHVIAKMSGEESFGFVIMNKGERSHLATLAAERL